VDPRRRDAHHLQRRLFSRRHGPEAARRSELSNGRGEHPLPASRRPVPPRRALRVGVRRYCDRMGATSGVPHPSACALAGRRRRARSLLLLSAAFRPEA
jgi:hypothetical protein